MHVQAVLANLSGLVGTKVEIDGPILLHAPTSHVYCVDGSDVSRRGVRSEDALMSFGILLRAPGLSDEIIRGCIHVAHGGATSIARFAVVSGTLAPSTIAPFPATLCDLLAIRIYQDESHQTEWHDVRIHACDRIPSEHLREALDADFLTDRQKLDYIRDRLDDRAKW